MVGVGHDHVRIQRRAEVAQDEGHVERVRGAVHVVPGGGFLLPVKAVGPHLAGRLRDEGVEHVVAQGAEELGVQLGDGRVVCGAVGVGRVDDVAKGGRLRLGWVEQHREQLRIVQPDARRPPHQWQEGRQQLALGVGHARQQRRLDVVARQDGGNRVGGDHRAFGNRPAGGAVGQRAHGAQAHLQQRAGGFAAQVGGDVGVAVPLHPGGGGCGVGGGAVVDQQLEQQHVGQRLVRGHRVQRGDVAVVARQVVGGLRKAGAGGHRDAARQRRQLVEQPRRALAGRGGHRQDVDGAGGLARQRHVLGVAAEFADIVLHEAQRLCDVQQGVVARLVFGRQRGVYRRVAQRGVAEEAQLAQAVVGADDHRVGLLGQRRAVVNRVARVAGDVAAAVDVDDDGQLLFATGGAPDVQRQAVFAARRVAAGQVVAHGGVERVVVSGAVQARVLDAPGAKARGVQRAGPGQGRARGLPAQGAHGRLRKWHALPEIGPRVGAVVHALHVAIAGAAVFGVHVVTASTGAEGHAGGGQRNERALAHAAEKRHGLSPWLSLSRRKPS